MRGQKALVGIGLLGLTIFDCGGLDESSKNQCTGPKDCLPEYDCVQEHCVDPCATEDCNNHGTCVTEEHLAQCVCDQGFEPDGLSCVDSSLCQPTEEKICNDGAVYVLDICGKKDQKLGDCAMGCDNLEIDCQPIEFRTKTLMNDWGIEGAELRVLDNATKEELGISTVSQVNKTEFPGLNFPKGMFGIHAIGSDGFWIHTYQFNLSTEDPTHIFEIMDDTVRDAFFEALGIARIPGKAMLVGKVVWRNPETYQESMIGCAQVKIDGLKATINYFNEFCMVPPGLDGRNSTHPQCSYFFVPNLEPGAYRLTAEINNQEIGSTETFGFPDSATVAHLVRLGAQNPTPIDCQ